MSRSINERLGDILDAIRAARVADSRMRRAETGGDDVGVKVAFDAIHHNLFVIGKPSRPGQVRSLIKIREFLGRR